MPETLIPPVLIPADVRHRLKGLSLVARRAVGDRGIGLHASHSRGTGLEFAQYRPYEFGDEPRQIDWKLYARSDRFFVREAERESPVALWILLDASASMAQADTRRASFSRLDAGKSLTAALAELALAQGDRFAFAALRDTGIALTRPASGTRHRDRLHLDLHALAAAGVFPEESKLTPLWERIGRRDLVVILSDWFDSACLDLARRLSAAGREVLGIQILTVGERDFDYDGGYRFRDPETGEELLGDGAALRAEYLTRFTEAKAGLHAALDAAGIRHAELVLDQPLDTPLQRLFGRTGNRAGGE
ncbi:DUF58 domain-containing protein [Sphingomonas albertensis]|uniref:DUF58 domain-containing protein n=1 Tax=Sphingomonas albertensis TaxID=2762591 RepID=UPI002E2AC5C4|nr:DUF58 domain-containing protein [Sphingomonas albertensis]